MWNLGGMSLTLHEDEVVTIHTKDQNLSRTTGGTPTAQYCKDSRFQFQDRPLMAIKAVCLRWQVNPLKSPRIDRLHAYQFSTLSTWEAKAEESTLA